MQRFSPCSFTMAPCVIVLMAVIAVAEIQPQRPILPQNTSHFAEYFDQVLNVQLWSRFEAQLPAPCAAMDAEMPASTRPRPLAGSL